MTVSSPLRTVSYVGTGAGTDFSVPFFFLQDSHLAVLNFTEAGVPTLLDPATDYTLDGAGNVLGGMVHLTVDLELNHTLRIDRLLPFGQGTDIVNLGAFYPEIHEYVFDLLAMLTLQEPSGGIYTTTTRPAASAAWNGRNIIVKDWGAAAVRQVCLETEVGGWAWKTYTLV